MPPHSSLLFSPFLASNICCGRARCATCGNRERWRSVVQVSLTRSCHVELALVSPPDIQTKSRESHMLCLLTVDSWHSCPPVPAIDLPRSERETEVSRAPTSTLASNCEQVGVLFYSCRQSHPLPHPKSESEGFMLPPPLPLRAPLPCVNARSPCVLGRHPRMPGKRPRTLR